MTRLPPKYRPGWVLCPDQCATDRRADRDSRSASSTMS